MTERKWASERHTLEHEWAAAFHGTAAGALCGRRSKLGSTNTVQCTVQSHLAGGSSNVGPSCGSACLRATQVVYNCRTEQVSYQCSRHGGTLLACVCLCTMPNRTLRATRRCCAGHIAFNPFAVSSWHLLGSRK